MRSRSLASVLIVVFCILDSMALAAIKTSTNNEIPRTSESITIDGLPSEKAWQEALQIDLTYEVSPGENLKARVKTSAYLISNDQSLFILIKAADPQPEKIRAYLSERDDISHSDHISISLDTFNDSRKAFKFAVNAIGVQSDAIIDEITGNEDIAWDSVWQSFGTLTPSGYQIELAIPFKSLRFIDQPESKRWKIKIERVWPREVVYSFTNITNDRNNECSLCQYEEVTGFANITPAQNITLIPALTFSQSDSRPNASSDWSSGDLDDRQSLDLRWGINQNLYLNATLNPDFSQVEADSLQLQTNKRFAIRTDEKRAFFVDGADYFSNWSKLVHTRLFTEPEYGIKLTGKSGEHSYGVIVLEDKDTNFLITDNQSSRLIRLDGIKSENQLLRYRYDTGEKGNLGFTYTSRDAGDYSNELMSFDGKYWFTPSTYFKFQAITTETTDSEYTKVNFFEPGYSNDSLSGDALSLNLTHSTRDWSAILTHHYFEDGFRADSGFVSRSDWVSSSVGLQYRWYPSNDNAWWNRVDADFTISEVTNIEGERLNLFRQGGVELSADYQSYFGGRFYDDTQNFVTQKLLSTLNPILLLQDYEVKIYELYGGFSPVAGVDIELFYEWGDDVEFSSAQIGKLETVQSSANYQFNDNWRFTLEYINQSMRVNGNTAFDVHLTNFRAAYQFDVRQSLRLTLQSQRESSDKSLASQLLYTYKLNPFTLFYMGYSDNAIADQQNIQLERIDRTVFVKFSYAWQL